MRRSLTRAQELSQTVTFVSFDWRALKRAKEIAPDILNAFTTLPFYQLDPEDASAVRDVPGSEDDLVRRASAGGAPWAAGFDWRAHQGATFAKRMLRAIASGPADGWFSWHGDVTSATATLADELGLAVSCWTVDDGSGNATARGARRRGDPTDRPDRLKKLFPDEKRPGAQSAGPSCLRVGCRYFGASTIII